MTFLLQDVRYVRMWRVNSLASSTNADESINVYIAIILYSSESNRSFILLSYEHNYKIFLSMFSNNGCSTGKTSNNNNFGQT